MKTIRNRLSGMFRLILLICGIAVLGWLGWTARDEISLVFSGIEPVYFVAAVLLGILFMVVQARLFADLLAKQSGQGGSRGLEVATFLFAQPGKYIPGKIWTAVMQSISLGRQYSFARVAIVNVELLLINTVHMTALGIFLLSFPNYGLASFSLALGIVIAAGIMCSPAARIAEWFPSKFRQWLGLQSIESDGVGISTHTALISSVALAAVNLMASLCVLWAAGDAIEAGQHANILAVFYLGFVASFLVLPVPAGVGVREAAVVGLGIFFMPDVSVSLLVSVALLARCWQLIVDVVCFGLGATMQERFRSSSKNR